MSTGIQSSRQRSAKPAVIGPKWHGRKITDQVANSSEYQPGFRYEIIDGRLYVSPQPNFPEDWLGQWLYGKLMAYSRRHPEVIDYISCKARVFLPFAQRTTCPEPDFAAYHNFPHQKLIKDLTWEQLSPILVAEILSESDPFKDLVRNVRLYLEVPSIQEYWIVDGQENPDRPTLIVYRRRGRQWLKPREINYGDTHTTPLLPGFQLLIDPRR